MPTDSLRAVHLEFRGGEIESFMKSNISNQQSRALELTDLGGAKRRSEPRYCVSRKVDILPCHASSEWKFLSLELVDCSRHGIGLISAQSFSPGQQFLAKLKIGKRVLLLIYTVKDCISNGPKFRLGAEFSGLTASPCKEDLESLLSAFKSESVLQ
jgi:hypothetical protein